MARHTKRPTKARSCGNKVKHLTRRSAEDHLWSLKRNTYCTGWLQVYKCRFCKQWHVGHS